MFFSGQASFSLADGNMLWQLKDGEMFDVRAQIEALAPEKAGQVFLISDIFVGEALCSSRRLWQVLSTAEGEPFELRMLSRDY